MRLASRSIILFCVSGLVGLSSLCRAQVSIRSNTTDTQWLIDAGQMTYVFGVNERKMLQSVYWGPKLDASASFPSPTMRRERASFDPPIATTPLEYAAWGAGLFTEPALKIDSEGGDRALVLLFERAVQTEGQLEVLLRDQTEPIRVHLYYKAYPEGILARWSRIENLGPKPVRIEQAASAVWNLPQGGGYTLSWLTGQHGAEWQLHTAPLQTGIQVFESRRGSTSHQFNPWFSIGRASATTERSGPVWFGELGWSGSWRMTVEDTSLENVRVVAGYNPFDFAYALRSGESLETPPFYAGYTDGGAGEASRVLHRFQMAEILPTRASLKPRPIIYNSWEATGFKVNEAGQMALAAKAAQIGVERFVIDDGWFGQRDTDRAGLGDWIVNTQKFPHGLKPVIDRVHELGMDFGLWVEPEMVNPNSDLFRKHPDWSMHFHNREQTQGRNQLVLNLARPDVKAWVFAFLDKLVSENDIAFLKWDYNRNWSEPGWEEAAVIAGVDRTTSEKEIYVNYVKNLYAIMQELRARHPKLEIESCAGGGGRVDAGILQYTDEVWPSDNTDALDRLSIQDGFTHAYAVETMAAWVTDVPNFMDKRTIPLEFRFLSAMQGALGIGGNLNQWTSTELSESARYVAFYKTVRKTIQQGNLYRLLSPSDGNASQVEYVARDGSQAILFAYLHSQRYGLTFPVAYWQGLDAKAMYRVEGLDGEKYVGEGLVSGSELMGGGVTLALHGDYDSTAVVATRVP